MRELARKISELLTSTETAEHRWRVSSQARIFPDGVCPFCEQSIHSPLIWKLSGAVLLGTWKINSGRWIFTKPRDHEFHPHVSSRGEICMGNAQSSESALFLGITPTEAFGEWKRDHGYGVINRWLNFMHELWNHYDCDERITAYFGPRCGYRLPCLYCGGSTEIPTESRCNAGHSRYGSFCTRPVD